MRRRDLMDTTPEVRKKYVELLRKMTPAQKVARQIELIELGRAMKEAQKRDLLLRAQNEANQSTPDTQQG